MNTTIKALDHCPLTLHAAIWTPSLSETVPHQLAPSVRPPESQLLLKNRQITRLPTQLLLLCLLGGTLGAMAAAVPKLTLRLTPSAKLILQRGDLTKFSGCAIVNAANERMLGGGGVDGAIHRAAGPALLEACKQVPQVKRGVRCPTGEARITPGGDLPADFVIHTVGPVYDSAEASAPLLESAYRSSLRLANERGLRRIAFPAISCGIFGYPLDEAAEIAVRVVQEEAGALEEVHFFLFGQPEMEAWTRAARAAKLEEVAEQQDRDSSAEL